MEWQQWIDSVAVLLGLALMMLRIQSILRAEIKDVRTEIQDLRSEVKAEIQDLRSEVKADIQDLRSEVKTLNARVGTLEVSVAKIQVWAALSRPESVSMEVLESHPPEVSET